MNGKILEEVYNRNAPTAIVSEYHSSFKGNTTTTRRNSHTTDSDTIHLSSEDTSPKTRYDLIVDNYVEDSNSWLDVLGLTYISKKQVRV